VLAEQVEYRADGLDIVDGRPTSATRGYQDVVNGDGNYSIDVVELHVEQFGDDYRLQTEGDHPIDHRAGDGLHAMGARS